MDARRVFVLWAVASLACEAGGPAPAPTPPVEGPEAGPAVSFLEGTSLSLAPGQYTDLIVQVTPPQPGRVRFALLEDAAGASLSASERVTDAQGLASVRLRAPRRAASFRVRASLEQGAASVREVTILESGTASVLLEALYHGDRATPHWEATLLAPGAPCGGAPAPGAPAATGALPLRLQGLSAGQPLRIRLRAGALALGCADLAPLDAGEERQVQILVKNTAIKALLPLDVRMGLSPEPVAWGQLLDAWRKRVLDAFLGGRTDDPEAAQALLDTMIVLASSPQRPALLVGRELGSWDELLAARFSSEGGPALVRSWLTRARDELRDTPGLLQGQLLDKPGEGTTFLPSHALGLAPQELSASKAATWKLDEGDTLLASGELRFAPSVLLRRAVERQLQPHDEEPLPRLRQATDCEAVGALLAATQADDGCEAPCLAALCNAALETMWLRATSTDTLTNTAATLAFTASGAASLDATARVDGFSGSWVGQLKDTQSVGTTVALQGEATASVSP
jgi:hypothetical protein